MTRHRITAPGLTAEITTHGAELVSLRTPAGAELLWQAGPAWPRHAPVLFPIVGRLAADTLRHAGTTHRLTQHGFARDRPWTLVHRAPGALRLRLADDAGTRAAYPFPFRLDLAFTAADATLTVTATLTNPADTPLPASLGAHPAFAWPLAPGLPKSAHRLTFAAPEPAPVRRLRAGLLAPEPEPTPIRGRTLPLTEALFAADALILDAPASRALRYTADGAPALDLAWSGYRELGLWSKPGADFLCIEPWHGTSDPEGFTGDFTTKPGLLHVPAGASHTLCWSVTVTA